MIVQLSDPHVVAPGRRVEGVVDTPALFAQAVAAAAALQPAAVLISGDLVDGGRPDEYRHLRQLLLPLTCPVWLMAGNHDDPAALRAAFPDHDELGASGPVQWVREAAGLRVVALDTTVPGRPHGALDADRLEWLDRCLAAAPSRPTLVAMHHPPFESGIGPMDAMRLVRGGPALEAVLRRQPQVQRVVCGHLHRPALCRFGGTVAMTVPSTAHQIALDLDPAAALAWRREPPGMAVHALVAGDLVTHFAATGDHGPSCPFT